MENELQELLKALLIDAYIVMTSLQMLHWNVKGPFFGPLHALFQEGYDYLFIHIDDIAERYVQLYDTIDGFTIPGVPSVNANADSMVRFAYSDVNEYIEKIRFIIERLNSTNDFATVNWLSTVIEDLEKYAWKLRATMTED